MPSRFAHILRTAALFAAIGPPIGSFVYVAAGAVMALWTHRGSDLALLPGLFILSAILSYLVGLVPAVVAGAIFALLPQSLRTRLVALGIGAGAVLLTGWFQTGQIGGRLDAAGILILSGAIAAVVCASVVNGIEASLREARAA